MLVTGMNTPVSLNLKHLDILVHDLPHILNPWYRVQKVKSGSPLSTLRFTSEPWPYIQTPVCPEDIIGRGMWCLGFYEYFSLAGPTSRGQRRHDETCYSHVYLLNSRDHAESHGSMGLQLNRMEFSDGLAKPRKTSDKGCLWWSVQRKLWANQLGRAVPQPVGSSHFPLSLSWTSLGYMSSKWENWYSPYMVILRTEWDLYIPYTKYSRDRVGGGGY